jgi:hypothetical protein
MWFMVDDAAPYAARLTARESTSFALFAGPAGHSVIHLACRAGRYLTSVLHSAILEEEGMTISTRTLVEMKSLMVEVTGDKVSRRGRVRVHVAPGVRIAQQRILPGLSPSGIQT